jgi:hypothetical protein
MKIINLIQLKCFWPIFNKLYFLYWILSLLSILTYSRGHLTFFQRFF